VDKIQFRENEKIMKEMVFYLSTVSKNKFFRPIRERKDLITILLETIRLIIYDIQIPPEKSCGKIILYTDKTSRLVYISDIKYFSINFPFFIDNSDGCHIYDKNDVVIDSRIISKIMELISVKNTFNSKSFSSFFDAMETIYDEKYIWECFFNLLTFEEGYIRFDNDEDHIAVTHPQHHMDLFYEENNKIKFGLYNKIDSVSFHNLLINNDFYFLNKSDNNQEPSHA
jgi:hypothetical protein